MSRAAVMQRLARPIAWVLVAAGLWWAGSFLREHVSDAALGQVDRNKQPVPRGVEDLIEQTAEAVSTIRAAPLAVDRQGRAEGKAVIAESPARDGTSDSHVDSEWMTFPRSAFSIPDYMALLPNDISAAKLWRHKDLNPGDVYVPPELRRSLDEPLRVLRVKFKQFEQAQVAAANLDFAAAKASEDCEKREIASRTGQDGLVQIPLEGAGVIMQQAGKVYAIRSPRFDSTLSAAQFLASECGSAIILWYRAHGLCPAPTADALLAALFARTEQHRLMPK